MSPADSTASTRDAYRLRDAVTVAGDVLVSRQPLVATRLNDAARAVVAELDSETFRTPESVAADTGHDVDATAGLLDRLLDRSFLEWRPGRDPAFRPPVSVVVTVRDDRRRLERCLDALAGLSYPDYEVVVVDDGSTDGTREAATEHALADAGRLRVVPVGSRADPLGIGASRNRGVAAAEHDVVAFTDADCRPTPNWLADLVPCLASHDLVGGRVRPAGSNAASTYEAVNSSLDMGAYAARVRPGTATPYLPTANLVGRRAVFEDVPFPDRNVAEDVDVCWRALDAGYDVAYTPTGVVRHDYRSRLRDVASRRSAYGASEALLERDYDQPDATAVPVPADALLAAVLAVVGVVAAGAAGTVLFVVAGLVGAVGLLARTVSTLGRYRRLRPAVSLRDVAASWRREVVSTAYAIGRETTRYYGGLLAIGACLGWLVAPPVGVALAGGVVASLSIPLVVEYAVYRPETGFGAYAAFFVADHGGYQYGVYRGALAHRTVTHLDPRKRFQISVPGSSRGERAASRDAGGATADTHSQ